MRDGTLEPIKPTVGQVKYGKPLFYERAVNSVHGDSNSGKTFTALMTVVQELKAGHLVVYIDFESNPRSMTERLITLGATLAEVTEWFYYMTPEVKASRTELHALIEVAEEARLVVIDTTGGALAIEGSRPNEDDEVRRWFQRIPQAIARRGPAVVVVDHVPKSDIESLWPIGSHAKRSVVSGAAYVQVSKEKFSRSKTGYSELICAKDREGNYAVTEKAAELHYVVGEGFSLILTPTTTTKETDDDREKKKILALLSSLGPNMKTEDLITATGGNTNTARKRIRELVETGHITKVKDGTAYRLTRSAMPFQSSD